MSAKVTVTIDPKTGERTYEVEGVGGVACDEITHAIEQSNEVKDRQYTEEYHQPDYLPDYINEGE